MGNITLIIGDDRQTVDTKDIEGLSINYNLSDITDFGSRETSFTKPINIIQTPATDLVFKSIFEINSVDGFDFEKKVYADIQDDNISILTGVLQLLSVEGDVYNVVISANSLNLIKDLGDDLIKGNSDSTKDLTFDTDILSHTPTLSSVRTLMDKVPLLNGSPELFYPIIDYNNRLQYSIDGYTYIALPAITARTLFDKIVLDSKYTVELCDEIRRILNKLVIPYNDDYRKLGTNFNGQRIYFGATDSAYAELPGAGSGSVPDGALAGTRYETGTTNDIYAYADDWSSEAQGIKIKQSGYISPLIELRLGNNFNDCEVTVTLTTKNGATITNYDLGTFEFTALTWQTLTTGTVEGIDLNEVSVYAEEGGVMYVSVTSTDEKTRINYQSSFIDMVLIDYLYSGEKTLNINDLLPVNYKKADFISDIFTLFNAKITVDKINETNLIIDTYESYNDKGTRRDWTEKVSDNGIKFEPLNASLSETQDFSMSDDEDEYVQNYNDVQLSNYQKKELKNTNEFSSGTTSIVLNSAPTAFNVGFRGVVTPIIINEDNIFQSDWKPRLLFYNKITGSNLLKWGSDNDSYSNIFPTLSDTLYPLLADNENADNVVLSFNKKNHFLNEDGRTLYNNNTIYNLFYKDEIEHALFSGSKKLNCQIHLTAADIYDLNFADEIEISNKNIGFGVYRINKITGYQNDGSLTSVELIQLRYLDTAFSDTIAPDTVYYTPLSTDGASDQTGGASSQTTSSETPTLDRVLASGNASTRGAAVDYLKVKGLLHSYRAGSIALSAGTQTITLENPFTDEDGEETASFIPVCFGKIGDSLADIRINWIPPTTITTFTVNVLKDCTVYYICHLINN